MTSTTTISPDRIHLDSGGHNPPKPPADGGPVELCFNEAVAMLRGEPHSDRPKCVSPVIRDFTLRLNDGLQDGPRQRMAGYFDRVVGTAGDGHDEARRELASQWLMREVLPSWLRLAKLEDLAVKAEAAAGLTGPELTEALRAIRKLTWDVTYERRASFRAQVEATLLEKFKGAAGAAEAAVDKIPVDQLTYEQRDRIYTAVREAVRTKVTAWIEESEQAQAIRDLRDATVDGAFTLLDAMCDIGRDQ